MYKVITKISDAKTGVFRRSTHSFKSLYRMNSYKETLLKTINDPEVRVSFTTYVKEYHDD